MEQKASCSNKEHVEECDTTDGIMAILEAVSNSFDCQVDKYQVGKSVHNFS
jgi:hypothetical protein